MKIQIDYRVFKAMAVLACKDDGRHAIACIMIDPDPKGAKIYATDGTRLGVYLCEPSEINFEDGADKEKIRLPVPNFSKLGCTARDPMLTAEITAINGGDSNEIVYSNNTEFSQRMKLWNAKYPNTDQVIPNKSVPATGLDIDLSRLTGFAEVAKILGGNSGMQAIHMRFHGDGAPLSVFTACPRFYGLIMPLRGDYDPPDWAKQTPKPEEPAPTQEPPPIAQEAAPQAPQPATA